MVTIPPLTLFIFLRSSPAWRCRHGFRKWPRRRLDANSALSGWASCCSRCLVGRRRSRRSGVKLVQKKTGKNGNVVDIEMALLICMDFYMWYTWTDVSCSHISVHTVYNYIEMVEHSREQWFEARCRLPTSPTITFHDLHGEPSPLLGIKHTMVASFCCWIMFNHHVWRVELRPSHPLTTNFRHWITKF